MIPMIRHHDPTTGAITEKPDYGMIIALIVAAIMLTFDGFAVYNTYNAAVKCHEKGGVYLTREDICVSKKSVL